MAGAGYKLFNTGDVLTAAQVNTYLQEQAVMRFANAAARTAALSGVLAEGMVSYLDDTNAVQVYNGSAWVNVGEAGDITAVTAGTGISGGGTSGDVTITNSMATAIDAKGDLIAGTADNAFSRVAVGNNGDTLVADSSTSTGLRWQTDFAAGKNVILNSDFRIAQRGTSFTSLAFGTYTLDRWLSGADGTPTRTVSQQTFTPGAAPVAGYEGSNFLRIAQTVAGSGGTFNIIEQRIEDVRTFAGQTVTFSFWGKAAANTTIGWSPEQVFGSGGSSVVIGTGANFNLTTSWQRFTATTTLPSISGKTIGTGSYLNSRFALPLNATFTVDIWGVQLEAGNVATGYETATGTLAGELAACQRYYWRQTSGAAYASFASGFIQNSGAGNFVVVPPVPMRIIPTSLEYANLEIIDSSYTVMTGSWALGMSETSNFPLRVFAFNGSGMTANRPGILRSGNTTAGFIGFSAEL